jgi:eukaryotic-like serine/threonine-protein kinase
MTAPDMVVAGRYRLVRSLGVGGMGRVWLARDEVLGREVAIKELALPLGLSNEHQKMRRRTLREARAAARLSHPSVVKIYNVESDGERQWIVMEYIRSRSLLQVVEENGTLPVEEVAGIGLAILSALDAANQVGVLHRDVKPSNVLIADDGRVVLTDFGSALLDESAGTITQSGVIVGSPQYIAPERARTGLSAPESDLWSLGATLYYALEGRSPYARRTAMDSLIALATEEPDRTTRAGPLTPVIAGLLQKDPRVRMSAAEAERRLWQIASVEPRVQFTVHLRQVPEFEPPGADPATAPTESTSRAEAVADSRRLIDAASPPQPAGEGRTSRYGRWRPRRWQLLAASSAAAALVAISAIALGADEGGRSSTGGATRGASPAGSPAATAPARIAGTEPPDGADQPELPAGYRWWLDPTGIRVAFPAGWEMLREASDAMLFRAPDDLRTLRVRGWDQAARDLTTALAAEEARARLPGYQRIRIQALPQSDSAEWEYLFAGRSGRLHVLERAFTVAGRTYLLEWQTPTNMWQANVPSLAVITQSFRPPGG